MARIRTQKAVSRRIDLSYFKRPHPLRTSRQVLVFLAGVVTILLLTFLSLGGDGRLHNPGSLTSAHAFIQHDCRACHDGGGAGNAGPVAGFSKTVSDVACLACHDGSVHHANQPDDTINRFPPLHPTLTAGARPASASLDPKVTAHNCVSCHVEHRGQTALLGTHPALCIDCHGNLSANAQDPGAIRIASRVTGFSEAEHPPFGRSLIPPGSTATGSAAWVDPTVLKFNHEKHNNIGVLKDNCTACHAAADPQVRFNEPVATLPPPYGDPKDRPVEWSRSQDRANMQPISYQRHCIGCHAMELPGKVKITLPHEDLATVRAFLAAVPDRYAQHLASLPNKAAELEIEVVTGRPPRQRRERRTLTEAEWVAMQLTTLTEAIDRAFGRDEQYAALKRALTPPPATPTAPATQEAAPPTAPTSQNGPNVNLLEHFVTYGIGSNCAYCHEVKGDVPALAFGGPSPSRILAETTPTRIPSGPRRWFVNSHFDHYAHRSVSCLDCHSKATTSQLTSDVLSPDIAEGAASCVSCHKADQPSLAHGTIRGAPTDCVTCHWFHDPILERNPDGTINPLLSLPTTRISNDPGNPGPYPAPHPPVAPPVPSASPQTP